MDSSYKAVIECEDDLYYNGNSNNSIDIYEKDRYTFSGILDSEGNELYRIKPKIGFI